MDRAARLTARRLHRLCHWGTAGLSGKAPLSGTTTLAGEEASSALHVAGNRATTVDSMVSPYLDFCKQFEDMTLVEHSVSVRGLDVDVREVAEKWSQWKALETHRVSLEDKRAKLTKTMSALKKDPLSKERISELKEHGRSIRDEVKAVTQRIWEVEEVAVIGALSLPNDLHNSTGMNDKLLFSVSNKPIFSFHPKSHIDLGAKSEELEIVDNSPTAYYLKNRLAILDLVCNDVFLTALKEQGFLIMSNTDFVKAAVMEGCGVHAKDRPHHNRLSTGLEHDTNALHLVGGGSLQAFAAYFTKHIIVKPDHLPVRVVAAGRNYSPVTLRHPGLLGCRQSSVIDGLILYEDVGVQEKTLLHEAMVTMIESYRQLGMHFQVVQYSAKHLYTHERAAIGVTMYSPHTGQYHEVGRISLCGDYISKRLWTLCRKDKKSASFVSMLHVRACHTARLLGLLMENCQEEDGTYTLPGCLQSAVDAF